MPAAATPKRITLSEVAEICGVSRQVVSLVASGKTSGSIRFSDETRDRVLKALEELGYRPNRTVRGFFGKRHGVIGVLGHSPYNFPQDALATMMTAAHQFDQMLNIEQLEDGKLPKMVAEDCVDGLILFETVDENLMAEIERYEMPVIQVNTNHRFGRGCLTFDEEGAVKLAVERFVARGCRRPGIVGDQSSGEPSHYSSRIRRDEFARQAVEAGMAAPVSGTAIGVYADHYSVEPTLEFLRANPQLDCLLLIQDGFAPAVYDAAAELGLAVPDDLAVIAWNNSHIAKTVRPGLTSFDINTKQLGATAVELLNDLLAGKQLPERTVLPFSLVSRQSV